MITHAIKSDSFVAKKTYIELGIKLCLLAVNGDRELENFTLAMPSRVAEVEMGEHLGVM